MTSEAGAGDVGVAVPAAGSGARMGGRRKAYLTLLGEPVLLLALRPFLEHPRVGSIAVALPPEDVTDPPAWLPRLDPRVRLVAGGATRLLSVQAALSALSPGVRFVLVHDAARPLVTRPIIDRCLDAVHGGSGAAAGWPAVDTLKETDENGWVESTPDRERFWHAQTPQGFPRKALVEAYRRALDDGVSATDDAALYARAGGRVRMVEGAPWNLKVTRPEDVPVAELLLRMRDEAGVEAGR